MAEAVGFEPTCPCGQLHFECSSLQPLRYASVYKYLLLGTNHIISSQPRYDHFDTAAFLLPLQLNYYAITFCVLQGLFLHSGHILLRMKTVYLSARLKNYEKALSLAGAALAEVPERADALLLPGGGDMHPRFYGQAINGSTDIDEGRDARELALIDDFLRTGRQVIGICRGLQVLNVYFGGTLRQHIAGHSRIDGADRLHTVNSLPGLLRELYGARFTVNSAHHQAVRRLGKGLCVLACADDGTVEAVGHKTLPVFAAQWHPERLCGAFAQPGTADGARLFDALLR